ncbi:hypothetical protein D3C78_689230 [compost metagenome]
MPLQTSSVKFNVHVDLPCAGKSSLASDETYLEWREQGQQSPACQGRCMISIFDTVRNSQMPVFEPLSVRQGLVS